VPTHAGVDANLVIVIGFVPTTLRQEALLNRVHDPVRGRGLWIRDVLIIAESKELRYRTAANQSQSVTMRS